MYARVNGRPSHTNHLHLFILRLRRPSIDSSSSTPQVLFRLASPQTLLLTTRGSPILTLRAVKTTSYATPRQSDPRSGHISLVSHLTIFSDTPPLYRTFSISSHLKSPALHSITACVTLPRLSNVALRPHSFFLSPHPPLVLAYLYLNSLI